MSQTILFPTDGEAGVREATEYTLDLAETIGAVVHVLFVVDERIYTAYTGDDYTDEQENLEHALEKAGQDALDVVAEQASERGIEMKRILRHGQPASEIVDVADEIDADTIVMGTKTKQGGRKQDLGSVSENVLRLTDRPVTVVKSAVNNTPQ